MAIQLGDRFPTFECETTFGKLKLPDYWSQGWGMLFSYPADFTPVSTTEMAEMLLVIDDFTKHNVKCIALSSDTVESHLAWLEDVREYSQKTHIPLRKLSTTPEDFPCPIISDPDLIIAGQLGILDAVAKNDRGVPLCARAVYIVGPDYEVKMIQLYPATTGRNIQHEIMRVIDSLQLTFPNTLATPAEWTKYGECMVVPHLSTREARQLFPNFVLEKVPSRRPYMRITPQPEPEPEPEEEYSD